MAFVPTRTDQTKYSAVDGITPDGTAGAYGDFGTPVEVAAGGFGIKRIDPRSGKEFFEYLDAMPMGKQAVQLAVEAGSAAVAATVGGAAAGFVAVDFATADQLDAAEIAADLTDGIQGEDEGPGDLT
jgi:hypothetical protein